MLYFKSGETGSVDIISILVCSGPLIRERPICQEDHLFGEVNTVEVTYCYMYVWCTEKLSPEELYLLIEGLVNTYDTRV